MQTSDWQKQKEEFEKADAAGAARLAARGIHNPRHGVTSLTAELYPEMKRYDELLAGEIIEILRKPSANPQDPQPPQNVKRDWASSAYDR